MQQQRKLLVLDLDYTLIYPSDTPFATYDFMIVADGEKIWVKKRPYFDQFIVYADEHYDLMVWSASSEKYVTEIVKHLLPNVRLVYVYTAKRCTTKWNQFSDEPHPYVIKDLKKVWRRHNPYTKANTFVLDDTPKTYIRNYGNAIPVDRYCGGTDDEELLRVIDILGRYRLVNNVRLKITP